MDKSPLPARWSDGDLLRRLDGLAAVERSLLPEVLGCLAEVERRGLPIELGYANLHEYCVGRLKWGEGAAMQRIIAARAADLYPEIYSFLREGALNLSAVSRLAPLLSAENRTEVLARAAGRKRAGLDELLDELRDAAARRMPEPSPDESGAAADSELPLADARAVGGAVSGVEFQAPGASREGLPPAASEPRTPPRPVWLSFPSDEGLRRDLERARRLLQDRFASGRIEDVIAHLLRDFLRRRDPERRAAAPEKAPRERPTRRVPRWVGDRVWARDGGRCAYVAPDGRRCGARRRLEYDHVRPWARGGSSDDPGNIRLLCRAHNLLVARRAFGDRVPSRRVRR